MKLAVALLLLASPGLLACRPASPGQATATATPTLPGGLVLSSTAGAAESVGNKLGEYQLEEGEGLAGRPVYRQRDTEGKQDMFLYYHAGSVQWQVGPVLGAYGAGLRSPGDSQEPPTAGWEYSGGKSWQQDDGSLRLEHNATVPVCGRVEVAATGEAARLYPTSLGSFLPTGGWLEGRPVYQREGGGRWLVVKEGDPYTGNWGGWVITDSSVDFVTYSFMSGRGTLSPGQEEAGGSRRLGWTGWVYWDVPAGRTGTYWDSKGAISVTCT
jgi:hypothetical protein